MNKLNVLKTLFFCIISISISSCDSDDSEPNIPESNDSILADYSVNIGFIKDFSINANNEINYMYTGNSSGETSLSIRKINNSGNITVLDEIDFSLFGNHMGITNSGDGNIYYVTDSNNEGNKVYIYSVNTSSSYSMIPISSPFVGPIRMSAIESFGDGTYIAFDYSALGLRRYVPSLDTDIIIAGSGNSSITDGSGLNADFIFVTEILSANEIIYVIDDSNNLRKVEENGNVFNVTTLISDYTDSFNDITVDNNGNILVLVNNKGIYKLNSSNNSLEEYLIGELKITNNNNNNSSYATEWGFFDKFLINENDLFLYSNENLIKISDFETKI
ncbi:hypothetical protein ACSTS3_09640 [Aquimarina muelleri]|uniref:hypothetical protein n=1 Tax=Aquimarina muelleri TaxID=279356 RepID=UPI003F6849E9